MELILNGYCRCCDGPRMVFADTEEREADCDYPACPHVGQCEIAARLNREFEEK